jgi:hypothetical protein
MVLTDYDGGGFTLCSRPSELVMGLLLQKYAIMVEQNGTDMGLVSNGIFKKLVSTFLRFSSLVFFTMKEEVVSV